MGEVDELLRKIGDGDIRELLTQFRGEIEAEHAKTLQSEGWRAPPETHEARLAELNAEAEALRKQGNTREVMAKRRTVGKEIQALVNDAVASGVKVKITRKGIEVEE